MATDKTTTAVSDDKPATTTRAPEAASTRGRQQTIRGIVVSDKMNKTRVIEVNRNVRHRLYSKSIVRNRRLFVHDEKNEAKVGDVVEAVSVRPLSRHKSFRLLKVVEKRVSE